jgi:hypothetical protein
MGEMRVVGVVLVFLAGCSGEGPDAADLGIDDFAMVADDFRIEDLRIARDGGIDLRDDDANVVGLPDLSMAIPCTDDGGYFYCFSMCCGPCPQYPPQSIGEACSIPGVICEYEMSIWTCHGDGGFTCMMNNDPWSMCPGMDLGGSD